MNVKCLNCGRVLPPLKTVPQSAIEATEASYEGIVDEVIGNYGSCKHDNKSYLAGLCDGCVTLALETERLLSMESETLPIVIRCVRCGKTIDSIHGDVPTGPLHAVQQCCWDDAIVHDVKASQGSSYEGRQFVMSICDACGVDAIDEGRLLLLDDNVYFKPTPETEAIVAEIARKYRMGTALDSFAERYRDGRDDEAAIHDWIDIWNRENFPVPLYQFLGMTEQEYARWVENKEPLSNILRKP